MITLEQAIALALDDYRIVYPAGVVPWDIEDGAFLDVIPDAQGYHVTMSYCFHHSQEAMVFYEAAISSDGTLSTLAAESPDILIGKRLAEHG